MLQALGVPTLAMRVDVTARGQLQPALEKVEETLRPVNILINNAGIGDREKSGATPPLASPLSSISEYLGNRHINQDSRVGILLSPRFFPVSTFGRESQETVCGGAEEVNPAPNG
jgi:NAD(P)-dependent dehydrogenase (short-subunit alcohol dehydrogenase family)